jgi:hypothetical protein
MAKAYRPDMCVVATFVDFTRALALPGSGSWFDHEEAFYI